MQCVIRNYVGLAGLCLLLASGCGTMRLSEAERVSLDNMLADLRQAEVTMQAIPVLMGEQPVPAAVAPIQATLDTARGVIPETLRQYPGELPPRVKLTNAQKDDLLLRGAPLAQQSVRDAQAVFDEQATVLLTNIARNLEIIWSANSAGIDAYRLSSVYAEGFNAFSAARQQYPAIPVPAIIGHDARFITFDPDTRQLVPRTAEPAPLDTPGVAAAIVKSKKIVEKILFHYLAKRGAGAFDVNEKPMPAETPGP